jgi:hypothetical protein
MHHTVQLCLPQATRAEVVLLHTALAQRAGQETAGLMVMLMVILQLYLQAVGVSLQTESHTLGSLTLLASISYLDLAMGSGWKGSHLPALPGTAEK